MTQYERPRRAIMASPPARREAHENIDDIATIQAGDDMQESDSGLERTADVDRGRGPMVSDASEKRKERGCGRGGWGGRLDEGRLRGWWTPE
jgi:hypothetical protein